MEALRFSDYCANCRISLEEVERILFVEKELGRCFCSEDCIRDYFQPTIEFMREELAKARSEADMTEAESSRYAHYQPLTLEDPDEVWVDETETGERHFTFISHFRQGEDRISYAVVCLTIEGVPSFVFLSFATRDEDLVDEYRRGIDLRVTDEQAEAAAETGSQKDDGARLAVEEPVEQNPDEHVSDIERLYQELRQPGDIAREDFPKYEPFIEATIDEPDEIWRFIDDEGNEWFTFIARQSNPEADIDDFTMIAVCEPAYDEGSSIKTFEVVFAFPTTDPGLIQHFRKGINSLNKAFGVGWARGRAA